MAERIKRDAAIWALAVTILLQCLAGVYWAGKQSARLDSVEHGVNVLIDMHLQKQQVTKTTEETGK